jgi:uncharacterized membrane protein
LTWQSWRASAGSRSWARPPDFLKIKIDKIPCFSVSFLFQEFPDLDDLTMVSNTPGYKWYKTIAAKILFVGLLLGFALVGLIVFYLFADKEMAKTLSLVFAAHTIGGRAAGIGLCIIQGINGFLTVVYNFYLEVLIVCFTYSFFVMTVNNYLKIRSFKYIMLRLERKARKYKSKVENYGWIGLFVFVMIPLPITGPVMGSIIGYLIRMRLWKNFTAVFLGTLAAIIVWVLFFDFLEAHLKIIRYVIVAILVIVGLSYFKTIKDWLTKEKIL